MFAGTFHSLLWTYLVVIRCLQLSAAVDKEEITIQLGQDVTLKCQAPNNNIIAVEWSRADLDKDHYVLLYRDDRIDFTKQDPSFRNRVDLQNRPIRDRDVSLILKEVTINDAGMYECHVLQSVTRRKKRSVYDTEPIKFIDLHVAPPGQTGGDTEDGGKKDGGHTGGSAGLKIGLSLPAVLLLAAVVF